MTAITANQRDVLYRLLEAGDAWIIPREIGAIPDSHHSKTLPALVRKGWVRQKPIGEQRSYLRILKCYQITDEGKVALDTIPPQMKITGDDGDAALFRFLFNYEPDTGSLTWSNSTARRVRVGDVAGVPSTFNGKRYQYVGVCRRSVMAHRIIWVIVHGTYPKDFIDHINGDGLDNRLSNLRECSNMENSQNRVWRPERGLVGAHKGNGGRWTSRIRVNGNNIHLGSFASAEEAHRAYVAAKLQFHTFSPTIRCEARGIS